MRDAIRSKQPEYGAGSTIRPPDDALLDAMAATPVLINRPFVFTLGVPCAGRIRPWR